MVLGCTHYPLIKKVLKKVCGDGIELIDSAEAVAQEVSRILPAKRRGGVGAVKILVSDKTERFERIARMIMGKNISIEEVSVDKE